MCEMTTATKERKRKTQAGGISLSVQDLKAALQAVAPAVPARSPKAVLQNVLLSGAVLSGSDGDVRIDVTLENTPPGGICVLLPNDRFSQIVRAAAGDEIELIPNGTTCIVKSQNGEWTLPTESAAEYPPLTTTNARSVTRLPADQFVRAVRGTVFATDNESSRYALGAVLVEVKGDTVTLVATDGRRLSAFACEHDLAVDDSQTLVPARAMAIISRLAGNAGDAAVQLEATASEIVATIGGTTVTARLVEGRFPKWRDVVPERDAKATTVDRAALMAATRAAAIVTSDSSKGVDYVFGKDGIWLHGQSAEAGESSVTCDVVEAGESCRVKLDPTFVVEWLNGISGDAEPEVEVEAVDEQSAVVLRCGDHTGVIMPLAKD
jgi:DNA polymerase-3 subunit beta